MRQLDARILPLKLVVLLPNKDLVRRIPGVRTDGRAEVEVRSSDEMVYATTQLVYVALYELLAGGYFGFGRKKGANRMTAGLVRGMICGKISATCFWGGIIDGQN